MAPIAVQEPQLIQVSGTSDSGVVESTPRWFEICNAKQVEREKLIPAEWRIPASRLTTEKKNLLDVPATCGILTEDEIKITSEFNAIELLKQIKSGKLSSETVTIAFCKRAAIAQQLVSTLENLCL
jgi:amidase